MGLFASGAGASLIRNEAALDFEFVPKILPFRESEQRRIVQAIKPLLAGRTGRNVCVFGAPGIGKTAAAKHVLRDLEEETDEVHVAYVNCWQHNTSFKIYVDICEQLGFQFTHNKNTQELFKVIERIVNKKAGVFVFDEVDKAEDFDFLYTLLEGIYKKTLVLITNYKEWVVNVDDRIRSRLMPEMVEFRKYNVNETRDILRQRVGYAFAEGVFTDEALGKVAAKAFELGDIRTGLFLLREAAMQAEEAGASKVLPEHVLAAQAKLDEFTAKSKEVLEEESKAILELVQKNSGLRIGDLFKKYQEEGGKASYKTFQRRIAMLGENHYVSVKKQKGAGGNTTIVERKLTEY
ncbi:AAA family ATPase [Candidatus Woesearchaeota archaeon]|nr:MAG: AAA family ATPase [Candidatus Woesearchaeota archaeon]